MEFRLFHHSSGDTGRHTVAAMGLRTGVIRKVHITNYRCFLDLAFEPGQRNLLVGSNGSGKSSLLDVLSAIRDLVVLNDEVRDALPDESVGGAGHGRQLFEVELDSPHGQVRYQLKVHHEGATVHHEELTVGGTQLYVADNGTIKIIRGSDWDRASIAPSRSFLGSIDPQSADPRIAWFRQFVEGIWIVRPNPVAMDSAGRSDDAFLDRSGANFPAWCRRLVDTERAVIEVALEWLKDVVPGLQDLRVRTAGRVRVLVTEFVRPDGSPVELDFDQLSDGQKILVLLYVMLAAIPKRATVLALDEPDNWVSLREIQPFLVELANVTEDFGIQTLIASHSAEVIDYLGPSDAWLFTRPDAGAAEIRRAIPDPRLRLSQLLARGWDAPR